jgi:hypothetical protein
MHADMESELESLADAILDTMKQTS